MSEAKEVGPYDFLTNHDYRFVGRMGEGTFSEVLKCQSFIDGKLYACKKMKQKYDNMEQVNNLREIQALRRLNPHSNIIELKEIIFEPRNGTLALICELMDMNIYELIKDRRSYLPEQRVTMYMYQLCKAIYHMHRNGIFHRDVKPENILIKDNVLKLADFGSCKSVYSKHPYTEYISTRWYRAPECLLTDGFYGHKMDLWSIGCVMFEVMTLRPLFPGSNEIDQVNKIHDVIGTPSPTVLQKFRKHQSRHMNFNFPHKQGSGIASLLKHGTKGCVDIITQLCTYDPEVRLSAKQALRHSYFRDVREAERKTKQMIISISNSDELEARVTQHSDRHSAALHHLQTKPHKPRHRTHKYQGLQTVNEYIASGPGPSGLSGKQLASGHFLPSIQPKKYHSLQRTSVMPSGYTSVAVSGKSSAHGSFLPSLYGEKVSKHPLYPPSVNLKQPPHKNHPSLPSIGKHRTGAG